MFPMIPWPECGSTGAYGFEEGRYRDLLLRSLTSQQAAIGEDGGRLVKHARYYWLLLAESHLTRRLFGAMVGRIAALPVPTG